MSNNPTLPLAIAAVVRRRDGRTLLIKRAPGVPAPGIWTPLTGRPDPGEALEDTVKRECFEEIGLRVRVGGECYRCQTFDGRWMLVWFECWPEDETVEPALTLKEDEVSDARWMTAREALTMEPMFPATHAFYAAQG